MKVASNARSSFRSILPLPFLIANPRLEFPLSHRKQTHLRISNRERMTIFHLAPSSLVTHHPPLTTARLIETLAISKIESTPTKHATKQNSNRYKMAIPRNSRASSSATLEPAASYPFAQFPNRLLLRSPQMLPLEIAPRRLG
jgi:hypothetical protein